MVATSIALRYLFSKKSHNAVNIISVISVAGVAVATAAIIIVLSVFNGFSSLAESRFSLISTDLRVDPLNGKTIENADSIATAINNIPGVKATAPVIREKAVIARGDIQKGVIINAVPANYRQLIDIDSITGFGQFTTDTINGMPPVQLGFGIYAALAEYRSYYDIAIFVPRRHGRYNPANPTAAFRSDSLHLTGIITVGDGDFDANNIFLPLETARDLLEYDNGEASYIGVTLLPDTDPADIAATIKKLIPETDVLDQHRQNRETFNMINIEKWVTFTMLIFILVIAAFNIISTLSLLVIEKRDNMETLRFLGAPRALVRRIFMIEGAGITIIGGIAGIILGIIPVLIQQHYGVIKLGKPGANLVISQYPVQLEMTDILAVTAVICLIALITSQVTRLFTNKIS